MIYKHLWTGHDYNGDVNYVDDVVVSLNSPGIRTRCAHCDSLTLLTYRRNQPFSFMLHTRTRWARRGSLALIRMYKYFVK